jgi:hypothetical protein
MNRAPRVLFDSLFGGITDRSESRGITAPSEPYNEYDGWTGLGGYTGLGPFGQPPENGWAVNRDSSANYRHDEISDNAVEDAARLEAKALDCVAIAKFLKKGGTDVEIEGLATELMRLPLKVIQLMVSSLSLRKSRYAMMTAEQEITKESPTGPANRYELMKRSHT